jgi:CheY-like chemotaxis protein
VVRTRAHTATPATGAAATTILVVDDEPGIRLLLELVLADKGFHVITARDGGEALRAAAAAPPAVVLTDLMMPVLDGYVLIDRLRSAPRPRPAIIAMSAGTGAVPPGADRFLAKPFTREQVIASIEALLPAPPSDSAARSFRHAGRRRAPSTGGTSSAPTSGSARTR